MAMKIYTNTTTNNTTTATTTEDLKWQALYDSCRCAQERFLYAELRVKGGKTADEAKEYMSKNSHNREIICDIKPSQRISVKEVSN